MGSLFEGLVLWIWTYVSYFLVWLSASIATGWLWLKAGFTTMLTEWTMAAVGYLPADWEVTIEDLDFAQWSVHFQGVSWIVPIFPTFLVISGTYAVVGLIRLVRHVLGFVPLVNAG